MRRFLIVDGSNLLFQMFFGMPARITNSKGKAIHGTIGFVGALLKIIRMISPTHAVVLFDSEHADERLELDPEYKANRPTYEDVPYDETPFSQLPDIFASLDCLGIKYAEITDREADDIVSGYAHTLGNEIDIVISSFDSDFFQLITDKVSVLRYRGDKTVVYTPELVLEKLGIPPALYADFKSLTGDSADNIKGAEGIGKKTAAYLVNTFGGVESIIENADKISKRAVKESVIRNTERLRINYKLIKLHNHSPLPFSLDELAYSCSGITTTEVLTAAGVK